MSKDEKQYHIHLKKGDVGRYVFLPGDPFRTDLIASYLDDAKLVAENREHKTWTGYLAGEKVSVTSTGMGCPSAAIAIEELIKIGADTFIRIGTAGRVSDESYSEDLDGVIVTAAVRDEGTSLAYVPYEYPAVANVDVVDALVTSAKNNKLNYVEGISQSKDSFYGQHAPDTMPIGYDLKNRWQAWKMGNVMCSEMEASILFIISSIKGCRTSAIMSFKSMEDTIQVACDAVELLIEKDLRDKL